MANKHEHTLDITGYRKMHIKMIGKYHNTQIRMVKIQNTESIRRWWGYDAIGNVGIQNHTDHTASMEDSMVISYKTKHIFNIQSSNHTSWCLPKGVKSLYPHKNTWMFIAVLFTTAKTWSNQDVPKQVNEWINCEVKWSHFYKRVFKWSWENIKIIHTHPPQVELWTFELGQNTIIPRTLQKHLQLITLMNFFFPLAINHV